MKWYAPTVKIIHIYRNIQTSEIPQAMMTDITKSHQEANFYKITINKYKVFQEKVLNFMPFLRISKYKIKDKKILNRSNVLLKVRSDVKT